MTNTRTALVIGGTGGVGYEVAKLFSRHGMRTFATYHEDRAKADEMKRSLLGCEVLRCDVKDAENVRETVGSVLRETSGIDILVNCVTSGLKLKPFEGLTAEEFNDDINTILIGSANVMREVVPVMKKQKSGVMINLLSSAMIDFPKRMSSYIAAKSGLWGLSKSLSSELGQFNLRVVGISPYFIGTDLLKAFPEKLLEMEKDKIIRPEHIARVVLKVVTDEGSYPNGTNLVLRSSEDTLAELGEA